MACVMFQITDRHARGYMVFHGKGVCVLRYTALVDGI